MSKRCLVVADGARARIFVTADHGGNALTLCTEIANPHFVADQGNRTLQTSFANEVAETISSTVRGWDTGSIVLAAAPDVLGLLRRLIQDRLSNAITLKALARDYTAFTPAELEQRPELI